MCAADVWVRFVWCRVDAMHVASVEGSRVLWSVPSLTKTWRGPFGGVLTSRGHASTRQAECDGGFVLGAASSKSYDMCHVMISVFMGAGM